jgi:hypothetical protein
MLPLPSAAASVLPFGLKAMPKSGWPLWSSKVALSL